MVHAAADAIMHAAAGSTMHAANMSAGMQQLVSRGAHTPIKPRPSNWTCASSTCCCLCRLADSGEVQYALPGHKGSAHAQLSP